MQRSRLEAEKNIVEAELKEGSEDAAAAFAIALAQEYGLRPETRSKIARAMALANETN